MVKSLGDETHTQSTVASQKHNEIAIVLNEEQASVLSMRCYKVAVCLWGQIEEMLRANIHNEVFITYRHSTDEIKLYVDTEDTNNLNIILDESENVEEILIYPTTLQKYYCSIASNQDYSNEFIRHLISQTLERHLLAKAQAVKRDSSFDTAVVSFPMSALNIG